MVRFQRLSLHKAHDLLPFTQNLRMSSVICSIDKLNHRGSRNRADLQVIDITHLIYCEADICADVFPEVPSRCHGF